MTARSTAPAPSLPLPPGDKGSGLPTMVRFLRDPLGAQLDGKRRHGPVFAVKMPGAGSMVVVTDPELSQQVFATDRDIGQAGKVRKVFLEPLVGASSLLTLDGEEWVRQRKMLGSAFHGKRIAPYADTMAEIAARQIADWPERRPFTLRPRFQSITLEVILRVVFGVSDTARLKQLTALIPPLLEAGEAVDTQMMFLSPRTWGKLDRVMRHTPGTPNRRLALLRRATDRLIYAEISERRADGDGRARTDVLAGLLGARDAEGTGLSDEELRDGLMTLLLAGHETTATALAWCFERLMRTEDVYERATQAADAGDTDYIEALAKETLRSRPVVPDMPRVLTEPMELGGYRIPRGWWVAPTALAMHHSPELYGDPQEFRPQRFLDEEVDHDSWIPFGGGRRQCLGAQFALMELKAIIPEVLRRHRLFVPEGVPDERIALRHVTLVPRDDARAIARPRVP